MLSFSSNVKRVLFIFCMIFFSSFISAETPELNTETGKKFNAGEMILEHVQDAHSWHLTGHFSVPLPMILKTDKGFEFFSSSVFLNEEHEQTEIYLSPISGYRFKLFHEHLKIVTENGEIDEPAMKSSGLLDFSITKNVFSLLFGSALMCWIFISVASTYRRRSGKSPKGLQSLIEPLIIFVRDDIAKTSIGPKYLKIVRAHV